MENPWNSLEITKLVVQATLPLVVAILGYWLKRELANRDSFEWRQRINIEWRIRVFEEISEKFNRLLCAFTYVGDWRTISPDDLIELKRELDRQVHTYHFLFSKEFVTRYERLIEACYNTNRGDDLKPAIRANVRRYRSAWTQTWNDEWEDLFVPEDQRLIRSEFGELYQATLDCLLVDIGIVKST